MLFYDIETRQLDKNKKIDDPTNNELIFFGAYSNKDNKYYCYGKSDIKKIKELFKTHDWFVGFNTITFDNPILENYGIKIAKYKVLDLLEIIKKRDMNIKAVDNRPLSFAPGKPAILRYILDNYKLDTICGTLGIGNKIKLENDDDAHIILSENNMTTMYQLINKKNLSDTELLLIKKYLKQDVLLTYKLWKWLEKYFDGFKFYLKKEDIKKLVHIKSAISVYAYKVITNIANIEEEYNHNYEESEKFEGAFIAIPSVEQAKGKIYCFDFNSLYPSIMIMANIYGALKNKSGWHGSKNFEVEGYYDNKRMSKVGDALQLLYEKRLDFKKLKDDREYGIKIVINTIYGLLGNPNFKTVFNLVGAGDVTRLARQFIKYAFKIFERAGYKIIYGDTDSCYVLDERDDLDRLNRVKDKIIKDIKAEMPFDFKHFDMGLDYVIKAIFFFKDDKGNLKKKNYLYVTDKNDIVIKGLPIIKSNCSYLSKYIFLHYIKPRIISDLEVKFDKSQIYDWVKEVFEKDPALVAIKTPVKEISRYKSKTGFQYQLSEMYGAGTYLIVKNKKYGVGKDKKYCTLEDFQKRKLKFDDLILDAFYQELNGFIKNNNVNVNVSTFDNWF